MLPQVLADQRRWMRWTRDRLTGGKRPVAGWGKGVRPMTFAEAKKDWASVAIILGAEPITGAGPFIGGIDMDDCLVRDERGALVVLPWAQDVLDRFPTYTEISPSGNGLKLITLGGPSHLSKHEVSTGPGRQQIEAYVGGRWFAFTGAEWSGGSTNTITECKEGWDWLIHKLGASTERGERVPVEHVIEPYMLGLMLERVDAERYRDYGRWRALMMSCHHATDSLGIEEFVAWSVTDDLYAGHEEKIRGMWEPLDASGGVGWGPLVAALRSVKALHLVPRGVMETLAKKPADGKGGDDE